MKESYREGPASRSGPESYADDGNVVGVATAGVCAGQLWSSEIIPSVCRSRAGEEKATSPSANHGEPAVDTAESKNLSMHRNFHRENREILLVSATQRGSSTSRDGTVGERLRR
jgi:hypothetical protein